jgi:hypothetical protein
VKIIHLTSLASIESILTTGVYVPAYPSPLAGDGGLNCFVDGKPRSRAKQAERDGAELHLVWTGPVEVIGVSANPPQTPDVLYDQHPWRAFIRVHSAGGHLHAVDFKVHGDVSKDDRKQVARIRARLDAGSVPIRILPGVPEEARPVRKTILDRLLGLIGG